MDQRQRQHQHQQKCALETHAVDPHRSLKVLILIGKIAAMLSSQ